MNIYPHFSGGHEALMDRVDHRAPAEQDWDVIEGHNLESHQSKATDIDPATQYHYLVALLCR